MSVLIITNVTTEINTCQIGNENMDGIFGFWSGNIRGTKNKGSIN